ncbi:MAG: glycosyltransferase family 87 protein [Parvularculaceae bacterium]
MFDQLKSGRFITPDRIRMVPAMLLVSYVMAIVAVIATSPDGVRDFRNIPLGSDFFSFWTAGQMVAQQGAASTYDPVLNFQMQQRLLNDPDPFFLPFLHPPQFLFLAIALAGLPYVAAWLTFSGLTMGCYVAAMRRLAPQGAALLAIIAAPAAFLNFTHGQTGFLIAALFAGALFFLDKRPLVAGLCIGLLAFKPQYGVFFPLVLLITGRWRVIFAAAAAVLAQTGAATLAFGPGIWAAFIEKAEFARTVVLENGAVKWATNQSMYSALRAFGAPNAPAYAVQTLVAIMLAASLVWLWRSNLDQRLKSAGLVIAAFLATPYALDYDLIMLAPAIALIASHGLEHGFRSYEKLTLALAWFTPLIAMPFAEATLIPIGLMTTLALYSTVIARLIAREAARPAQTSARSLTAG